MTILRDISSMYASFFSLVLFMILFESRYPRKKALTLTLSLMVPLLLVNFAMLFALGSQKMSTLLLLTSSLPSLIFFWVLSKHRDGRFFFTFCLADTLVLEVLHVTTILDFFLGNTFIFTLAARVVLCPLLAWVIFKWVRPTYLDLQNKVRTGWYIFAAIALIFYVALSLSMSVPTIITQRLNQLPAFVLLLILMPAIYIQIFSTLLQQQKAHETAEQENILRVQVMGMTARIEDFSATDEKFRMERHNFRHKMQAIACLVEKEEYDKLHALALEYNESIQETQVKRYCSHAVLDAVLFSYLQKAEGKGIKVSTRLTFPDILSVNEAELATVFANAIENAINACVKLPPEKRQLGVKVLTFPQFMLQVSNSFDGVVKFDKNNIPVSREDGHGFGTRSIVAFCDKHSALYEFKATDDTFYLRVQMREAQRS